VSAADAGPLRPPVADPAAPPSAILARIAADLAAGSDWCRLLDRFLEPIVLLAGAQAGAVRVLSDDGQRLHLVSEIGLPPQVAQIERDVERQCGVCGLAASGDASASSTGLQSCTMRDRGGDYFGQTCHRVLAVPLRHRGKVLGVYNLFFDSAQTLTVEIEALLKSVGELLGLALHNARLERENLRVTVMAERAQLAADLHDSIAQSLAFVKMRMPLLQEAMRAHDDPRSARYFDDVRQAVGEAHRSLREILTGFRIATDPLGLRHALIESVKVFRERSGVDCEFNVAADELGLSPNQENQVLQIVREGFANITKHAAACHASLAISRDGDQIEVAIDDDGTGVATCARAGDGEGHFGIDIMGERARRLGGTLAVTRRSQGGTRVALRFPVAGCDQSVAAASATGAPR
jgi:two-component system nitrate/nitrite sensor histidine kinase NarX